MSFNRGKRLNKKIRYLSVFFLYIGFLSRLTSWLLKTAACALISIRENEIYVTYNICF